MPILSFFFLFQGLLHEIEHFLLWFWHFVISHFIFTSSFSSSFLLGFLLSLKQITRQANIHTCIFFYRSTAEQAALLGDRAGTAGWAFTF